jgi:hypothetical protein
MPPADRSMIGNLPFPGPTGYQPAIRKDPVKVRMAIPAADPPGNRT